MCYCLTIIISAFNSGPIFPFFANAPGLGTEQFLVFFFILGSRGRNSTLWGIPVGRTLRFASQPFAANVYVAIVSQRKDSPSVVCQPLAFETGTGLAGPTWDLLGPIGRRFAEG